VCVVIILWRNVSVVVTGATTETGVLCVILLTQLAY
jgi:hypothetical protein